MADINKYNICLIETGPVYSDQIVKLFSGGKYSFSIKNFSDSAPDWNNFDFRDYHLIMLCYEKIIPEVISHVKKIKKILQNIPVIIVFEYDSDFDISVLFEEGADDVISLSKINNSGFRQRVYHAILRHGAGNAAEMLKLKKEEKLLKILMDNIPDSIYFKDMGSRFIKVNQATLDKFGFKDESSVKGKTDLDIFGDDHAKNAYMDEQEIINTGKPIVAKTEREDWKDGRITWVSTTKLPIHDELGGIKGTFGITRDITKQVESEKRYKKEKERIDLLLKIVPSAILTIDKDKKITSWNRMAETITGFTAAEVLGKSCDIFSGDACRDVCSLFDDCVAKPQLNIETTLTTKDGELKYILKNIEVLKDDNGEITGGIESFIDVTRLATTAVQLTRSEHQFRAVWESANEGMRITDKDGIIMKVNDAYCRMVRKSESELIGKMFTDVYHKPFATISVEKYKERFRQNLILPRIEEEEEMWDNSKFWFSIFSNYMEWDTGERVLLSVFRDITDAKKSEIIQQVVFDLNNIVYNFDDLDILLNKIHSIMSQLAVTDSFFIASYKKESNSIDILYSNDESGKLTDVPVENSFTGYVIKTGESLLIKQDESEKMIKEGKVKLIGKISKVWLGIPVKVDGQIYGVVVLQDYTDENAIGVEDQVMFEYASDQIGLALERILSRRKLVESEQELREANETKDRFFSIISHDLRNPIITIDGFLKVLAEEYNTFSKEELEEYLGMLTGASAKTLSLLDNLLTWSRSQRSMIQVNIEKLEVEQTVQEAVEPLFETANNKNITVSVNIEHSLVTKADKYMFQTVVRNLVSNAIKFTNDGGKIEVNGISENDKMILHIKDNGVGMKPSAVEKLFRLDQHHSTTGTANEAGTGLGLILCKDFMKKNSGTIEVKSKEGEGTTFTVTLPLV